MCRSIQEGGLREVIAYPQNTSNHWILISLLLFQLSYVFVINRIGRSSKASTLIIKETQINTEMRHHLPPVRMATTQNQETRVGEDVGRMEPLSCWWECEMPQPLGDMVTWFKKLSIELSSDPVTPLLSVHPKERGAASGADTCIPTFTAALCTKPNGRGNRMWSRYHGLLFHLRKEGTSKLSDS